MNDRDDPAEEERLRALYRYDVLDTPQEESFDRITRLAQSVMQTPIALVSLVDRHRQWFKAARGIDATETPRDVSFCAHAIKDAAPMVVRDARQDSRFNANPMVVGEPWIRFYLGVPLRAPDGQHIGTLCTVDNRPRDVEPGQIALLQDLARLVIDELELRQIATSDSLTGLLTRRAWLREGDQALRQARRYGRALSCITLDIDHFKSVNDRHGHATGDLVLLAVADACRSVVRTADIVGRLGGEEFALLLPETDLAGASRSAERIRAAIAAAAIPTAAGTLRVTASFGVAELHDADSDIPALLRVADAALYDAKRAGRDRVVATAARP